MSFGPLVCVFLFISHFVNSNSCFLFYLGFIDVLNGQGGLGLVATWKTGPNDARHVVWALGTCLFLRVLFFSLHVVYSLYLRTPVTGPKRRVSGCFGPSLYIFFLQFITWRVRVSPGPTLARPDWPGVKLTLGTGQLRAARPWGPGSRARKNGLALARPGLWTVYRGGRFFEIPLR